MKEDGKNVDSPYSPTSDTHSGEHTLGNSDLEADLNASIAKELSSEVVEPPQELAEQDVKSDGPRRRGRSRSESKS
jgi:hypothetical protein